MAPGSDRQEPRWFAIWTKQRSEKAVARRLASEAVEHWLPLVTLERRWSDRTQRVEFPLLPNYLFVKSRRSDVASVTRLPGVLTVIRAAGEAIEVPTSELHALQVMVSKFPIADTPPEVVHDYEPGEPVRVVSGPFRGMIGIIRAQRGSRRLLVGLERLGIAASVDIGVASVVPASGA
jgi:transcriptional antiterminator RfaH